MGAPGPVIIGPLRTTVGLADVRFDGTTLRLVVLRGPFDVVDRYRLVLLAVAATAAVATWYAAPPGRWVGLGLTVLVAAVGLAAPRRTGSVREWPETDLHEMDPVHGAWRAILVLRTESGELRLSGWFWRRRQLAHLQKVLGRDSS